MEHFRIDNTEGFTQEQLDELNRIANEQITDDMEPEEVQAIEERILKNF